MNAARLNWEAHNGDGAVCLMVHGALGSRSYWNENLPALATVCRPVPVELWGHGGSPSPAKWADHHADTVLHRAREIRSNGVESRGPSSSPTAGSPSAIG